MSGRIKCDVRSRRAALWRRMSGDALEEGGREASLRISGEEDGREGCSWERVNAPEISGFPRIVL
jgi:hypothetical protein